MSDAASNQTFVGIARGFRAIGPLKAIIRFPRVLSPIFAVRKRGQIRKLRRMVRTLDAFDAIENMRLASTPLDPETYRESEYEGLMATPELVALAFAEGRSNPTRKPSPPRVLTKLEAAVPTLLMSSNLHLMFSLQGRNKAESTPKVVPRLSHATITREHLLRNPRFFEKEVDLLSALFEGPTESTLRVRLGFGFADMLALFEGLASWTTDALRDALRDVLGVSIEQLEAKAEESTVFRSVLESYPEGADVGIRKVAGVTAFQQLASLASLDIPKMTALTGLDREVLSVMLDRLSIDLDAANHGLIEDFLSGNNPLRTRPFVKRRDIKGSEEWLLVQPSWLIYGMRELFESVLTEAPMDQSYMKHRGETLERLGIDAVIHAARPDRALANVEYTDRNNQRFEADGLIFVGNVAIVLEAKSNRVTPYARTGAADRLWRELGPIISKAAEQAERLSTLLLGGDPVHIRSSVEVDRHGTRKPVQRNWELDASAITEVFTLALTLEDLNFVATITSELVESGLISDSAPSPWVINIHDLEIASEILVRPSEFVHFLSRRRRAANANTILANDELDYLMHYLLYGLYTDEPRENGGVDLIASLTDSLDEWYAYEHGHRETPAAKPAQPINQDLGDILDLLELHRPAGWLQASFNLLEMDGELRDQLGSDPRMMREMSGRDSKVHSKFLEVHSPNGDRFGVIVMSFPRGKSMRQVRTHLMGYLALRKYASKLGSTLAFAVWQGSQTPFDIFVWSDEPWQFDRRLEGMLAESKIGTGAVSIGRCESGL